MFCSGRGTRPSPSLPSPPPRPGAPRAAGASHTGSIAESGFEAGSVSRQKALRALRALVAKLVASGASAPTSALKALPISEGMADAPHDNEYDDDGGAISQDGESDRPRGLLIAISKAEELPLEGSGRAIACPVGIGGDYAALLGALDQKVRARLLGTTPSCRGAWSLKIGLEKLAPAPPLYQSLAPSWRPFLWNLGTSDLGACVRACVPNETPKPTVEPIAA